VFLKNHIGTMALMDFFVVPTAPFRLLYVLGGTRLVPNFGHSWKKALFCRVSRNFDLARVVKLFDS
jgi:hypothetical protein